MFRSVRARIVAMTTLVVITSVVLTAVMVSLAVQRAAQEEAAQSLSNDATIYQELLGYGAQHTSWDEVTELVKQLATQYDRRIALKTSQGRLLVDSDQLLGLTSGSLRNRPEVTIDPYEPWFGLSGLHSGEPLLNANITGDDREAHAERMVQATTCLDTLGTPYETVVLTSGLTEVAFSQQVSDEQWDQTLVCLSPLEQPLPSEKKLPETAKNEISTCLQTAGIEAQWIVDELGQPIIANLDVPRVSQAWETCIEQQRRSSVAPAVQLYLGSEGRNPLSLEGLATLSTALIAFGIIAIAGIAVIVLSARIVRPLQLLTAATTRLGAGDLDVQVAVPDRSEIGVLADTFNSMAQSLSCSERARRQLIADIAHELGNPMVTLGGSLEAIQDGIYEPSPEVITSLAEETAHLQHLITDLQELALADTGNLTITRDQVNLAEMLNAATAAYAPVAAAAGVTLKVTAEVTAWVEGDETRLRQVVTNLLSNAIHHTPEGGLVSLTVTPLPEAIRLEVSDTGEGVPAEQLPHVFERFWRADPSRHRSSGRTGLGLAISEALVHAHHGTITVSSQPGQGTTFTITLPTRNQT